MRPGEKLKNLETHGRIARPCDILYFAIYRFHSIGLLLEHIKNELEMPSDQLKKKMESD